MSRVHVITNADGVHVTAHRARVWDIDGEFVSTVVNNLTEEAKVFYGDPCVVNLGYDDQTEYWLSGVRLATDAEITAQEEQNRLNALSNEKRKEEKASLKAAEKARGDLQALKRAQAAFPDIFDKTDSFGYS